MKSIAIIPARGGSKRIPLKNIRDFNGKPIIAYSIIAALESKLFTNVVVSTDSQEIGQIAKSYGAEFVRVRPKDLSDDFATSDKVICDEISYLRTETMLEFDYVACIYATAPMITKELIKATQRKFLENPNSYLFAATKIQSPIERSYILNNDGTVSLSHFDSYSIRSQDFPERYFDAGQIYWGTPEIWNRLANKLETKNHVFELNWSHGVDIDTLDDWKMAELLAKFIKFES